MTWPLEDKFTLEIYGRGRRGDIAPPKVHATLDALLAKRTSPSDVVEPECAEADERSPDADAGPLASDPPTVLSDLERDASLDALLAKRTSPSDVVEPEHEEADERSSDADAGPLASDPPTVLSDLERDASLDAILAERTSPSDVLEPEHEEADQRSPDADAGLLASDPPTVLSDLERDAMHALVDSVWLRHSRARERLAHALVELHVFSADEVERLSCAMHTQCLDDCREIMLCIDPRSNPVYHDPSTRARLSSTIAMLHSGPSTSVGPVAPPVQPVPNPHPAVSRRERSEALLRETAGRYQPLLGRALELDTLSRQVSDDLESHRRRLALGHEVVQMFERGHAAMKATGAVGTKRPSHLRRPRLRRRPTGDYHADDEM
ncbi:hypothetical protein AURDEDRAFT_165291 [Auricularia subglabra TFB-10046 SS5]|nr:hypothetical protein AURDEDRAFT_165291 [Auricularia subglabra TFB-10046 SS5]